MLQVEYCFLTWHCGGEQCCRLIFLGMWHQSCKHGIKPPMLKIEFFWMYHQRRPAMLQADFLGGMQHWRRQHYQCHWKHKAKPPMPQANSFFWMWHQRRPTILQVDCFLEGHGIRGGNVANAAANNRTQLPTDYCFYWTGHQRRSVMLQDDCFWG